MINCSNINGERFEADRLEKFDNRKDIEELISVIKGGRILEVGCGTGKIIQELSKNISNSTFVGVDISGYMIKIARKKGIKNARFIKSESTKMFFKENSFDYVIFRDSIHEIHETSGYEGMKLSLAKAYYFLKPGGKLIIRDAIVPPKKKIMIKISAEHRIIFDRFKKNFSRKISYNEKKDGSMCLWANDIIEFFSETKKIETRNCDIVINESKHLSLEQYKKIMDKYGFKQNEIRLYKFQKRLIPSYISVKMADLPYTYCMLVYEK
jgi:ubiquinone/menaquinone biosynthesis C-methylase UbiE